MVKYLAYIKKDIWNEFMLKHNLFRKRQWKKVKKSGIWIIPSSGVLKISNDTGTLDFCVWEFSTPVAFKKVFDKYYLVYSLRKQYPEIIRYRSGEEAGEGNETLFPYIRNDSIMKWLFENKLNGVLEREMFPIGFERR